ADASSGLYQPLVGPPPRLRDGRSTACVQRDARTVPELAESGGTSRNPRIIRLSLRPLALRSFRCRELISKRNKAGCIRDRQSVRPDETPNREETSASLRARS